MDNIQKNKKSKLEKMQSNTWERTFMEKRRAKNRFG